MSHKIELSVTKCYVKMCPCPFLPFFRSLPFYCTILLLSALQLYRISCSKVLGKNGKWVSEESRVLNDPSNRFYDVLWCFTLVKRTRKHEVSLTDDIFETGVYGAPSKSQNPIVLGQGGPSSTQCSNPYIYNFLKCGRSKPITVQCDVANLKLITTNSSFLDIKKTYLTKSWFT